MAQDLVDNEINLEETLIPMQGAFGDLNSINRPFRYSVIMMGCIHDDWVPEGALYGIQQRLMLLPI